MKNFLKTTFITAVAVAAVGSVSSGVAQSIPVQRADQSHVANPPPPIEPGVKGYGVKGVEGRTLDEMVAACKAQPAVEAPVAKARCEQLRRTMKNQPGGQL